MNLLGIVHEIFEAVEVSEKFKKRELILDTGNEKYRNYLKIEFVNDKCSLLDGFKKGDNVDVSFTLKGTIWKDKTGKEVYFNSIKGNEISKVQFGESEANKGVNISTPPEEDDLPF